MKAAAEAAVKAEATGAEDAEAATAKRKAQEDAAAADAEAKRKAQGDAEALEAKRRRAAAVVLRESRPGFTLVKVDEGFFLVNSCNTQSKIPMGGLIWVVD